MNAVKDGRFRLSVSLDAVCHVFIEKFIDAGFFESRDEMIEAALDALARDIEANARRTAMEEGLPNAEDASLAELADMLGQSGRWREN